MRKAERKKERKKERKEEQEGNARGVRAGWHRGEKKKRESSGGKRCKLSAARGNAVFLSDAARRQH